MEFRGELQKTGGNTTGFQIPDEFVTALGGGGRPKVVVRAGEFEFRSSIAKMGGSYWLGVSAERRTAGGLEGGQVYDLDITLDEAPRAIEVPEDLAAALAAEPEAKAFWDGMSFSNQRWHAEQLTSAKTAETRARRLAKSLDLLRAGKAR
ncbi:YdeI/OmpD-associated family protein [Actinoplanes sp. NEAU-A12]|uniref:YdeI/OmpD-associated family protein n=1 Tax=Actinoplanes sandaracinus TaxID=3045177 RepID=A0ABT6WTX4_9ACTN|nr:YdeI/OmpD-associated family protein [Actinoplanes sandaracinus]MDI6103183.1 YdeI/OmpD-associated family protein [Actinoplanes sandaracinus]